MSLILFEFITITIIIINIITIINFIINIITIIIVIDIKKIRFLLSYIYVLLAFLHSIFPVNIAMIIIQDNANQIEALLSSVVRRYPFI